MFQETSEMFKTVSKGFRGVQGDFWEFQEYSRQFQSDLVAFQRCTRGFEGVVEAFHEISMFLGGLGGVSEAFRDSPREGI